MSDRGKRDREKGRVCVRGAGRVSESWLGSRRAESHRLDYRWTDGACPGAQRVLYASTHTHTHPSTYSSVSPVHKLLYIASTHTPVYIQSTYSSISPVHTLLYVSSPHTPLYLQPPNVSRDGKRPAKTSENWTSRDRERESCRKDEWV